MRDENSDFELIIFIDRDCIACSLFARFIHRCDKNSKIRVSTFETPAARQVGLLQTNENAIEIVAQDKNGKIYRGPEIISQIFCLLPFPLWGVGLVLKIWPMRLIFQRIYPIFARYRKRFLGRSKRPYCER